MGLSLKKISVFHPFELRRIHPWASDTAWPSHRHDLKDDLHLVRHITVLIDLRVHHMPVNTLHDRWN